MKVEGLTFQPDICPATFQQLMEHGLHWESLLLYLDNIIVIASDFQTHIHQLEEVFQRVHHFGLKLRPTKCELLQKEVHYLEHIVNASGVSTDPGKIAAIWEWPTLKELKKLQALLDTV